MRETECRFAGCSARIVEARRADKRAMIDLDAQTFFSADVPANMAWQIPDPAPAVPIARKGLATGDGVTTVLKAYVAHFFTCPGQEERVRLGSATLRRRRDSYRRSPIGERL